MLHNFHLFDRVKNTEPPDASGDPERRQQWLQDRRQALAVYCVGCVLAFAVVVFALAFDRWWVCECTIIGPFQACSRCIFYQTQGSDGQLRTAAIEYKTCVKTRNFSQCLNPSWNTIFALNLTSAILLGLMSVLTTVDVVFGVTPRRPMYALLSLLIWSLLLSLWTTFYSGASTPVSNSLTRVGCTIELSFAQGVDDRSVPRNPTGDPAYPSAINCGYGTSFWCILGASISWTGSAGFYFYHRYMSWRKWGSQSLVGKAQSVIHAGGSVHGSTPSIGGGSRPAGHRHTDSLLSQTLDFVRTESIAMMAEAQQIAMENSASRGNTPPPSATSPDIGLREVAETAFIVGNAAAQASESLQRRRSSLRSANSTEREEL